MTETNESAARQRRYEDRLEARGLHRLRLWVPESAVGWMEMVAMELRSAHAAGQEPTIPPYRARAGRVNRQGAL